MLDFITHYKSLLGLESISSLSILSLLGIVIVLYIFKKVNNFYLISLLTLPGTFMHELMHFIVSFILLGNPVSFSVIPKRAGNKIILGSVSSTNVRFYNGFFIALAPLLLLPLSYFLLVYLSRVQETYYFYIGIYLIANLIYASIPSSTDWKLAFKKSWLLFIVIALFVGYYYRQF